MVLRLFINFIINSGIGVDDLFVIIQTWDNVRRETTTSKDKEEDIPQLISRTMRHAVSKRTHYLHNIASIVDLKNANRSLGDNNRCMIDSR